MRQVGKVWQARNLEPQVSELERCTPEEFARRLGLNLATNAGEPTEKEEEGTQLRAGELWPWLWLLLVMFWVGEGLLANRTVA